MKNKPTHGGQRKGAGRPPKDGPKKYYSLYLKTNHMDLVPDEKSKFVSDAIKAKLMSDGLLSE
jgi:hypothetical protein